MFSVTYPMNVVSKIGQTRVLKYEAYTPVSPCIYRFPESRTGLHFPQLLGLRAPEKLLSVVSVLCVIIIYRSISLPSSEKMWRKPCCRAHISNIYAGCWILRSWVVPTISWTYTVPARLPAYLFWSVSSRYFTTVLCVFKPFSFYRWTASTPRARAGSSS